eukprot:TRINITY_DN311_c0_g1_i1.p1 TRINITY_DN311_c0_g1~~TRINITY_DN311_c0_g1_i1.p1  ORF type:complete len:176 (-),score=41.52 TRINITY_DN311_c0_g1_i1:38-565(-)
MAALQGKDWGLLQKLSNLQKMADLYQSIIADDSQNNWCVLGLENGEVIGQASGNGIDSFKQAFDPEQIQWGIYKIMAVDEQAGVISSRTKICQVNWVGRSMSAMKKMAALQGKEQVREVVHSVTIAVDADTVDDIDTNDMARSLLACGGAHKPKYYDFGEGSQIETEFYTGGHEQ